MSLKRIRIFTEQLFQFCLQRRGIVWQPAPRDVQAENADPLFQDIIGNAVLNTCIEFQQDVHQHSTSILNDVSNLILTFSMYRGYNLLRINTIFHDILEDEMYPSQTQATYVFLAVMVDVATQSARDGDHHLIQSYVSFTAHILDKEMPNGFIQNFEIFLWHAIRHGQTPGN